MAPRPKEDSCGVAAILVSYVPPPQGPVSVGYAARRRRAAVAQRCGGAVRVLISPLPPSVAPCAV